ncbi:hypothetical protein A2W14_01635 [Candidatus Gottesmanbacteria bacterium RBG_16_37_8]|uniref:Glycosyltransferase 2-like domain-containing protein n=1 Tax=Candidatus Gottesmanbacteria bacterium RBG_16_37_8 TaxID=1798371 RepID=A0A1F5YQX8_9BACT|nr:MAG: hypothetical protein A2W14_01635 [Candidatus Gottesmanbacteria bacterium RBG_16_37_8]
MNKIKNKISVVLPTYNEADNIIPLIETICEKLKNFPWEIIVVDDNSPDKTGILVRKKFPDSKNIKVFIRKEKGLATAIFDGLKKATGSHICVMDTDFNHDPKEIPKMYKELKKCDLIVGSRYVEGGGMENRLRNSFSLVYNRIIQFMLRLPTRDNLSGYFMIRGEKLTHLLKEDIFRGYGDYFIRLLYRANKNRLLIKEIPVYYKNRIYGVSKSQFLNMFVDYTKTVFDILRQP